MKKRTRTALWVGGAALLSTTTVGVLAAYDSTPTGSGPSAARSVLEASQQSGDVPSSDASAESGATSETPGSSVPSATEPAAPPAPPTDLCAAVPAAAFESATGMAARTEASASQAECDYAVDEGSFARVTSRPVDDDFTSWAAYVGSQPPAGPETTYPEIADGAIVTTVEDGSGRTYVTAEAYHDDSIITWELALPVPPDEARETASTLLRTTVEGVAP